LLLTLRVENAEDEGRLIGVMGLSASEGAPIWGGPVRRRFTARERSDMVVVVTDKGQTIRIPPFTYQSSVFGASSEPNHDG
jgi:hypothetical protein